MSRIPTESRIFADRYFREARRLEALHASRISPGTSTWRDALRALCKRMSEAAGPIKQARMLKQAGAYLDSIAAADAMHVGIAGFAGKRSAALCFATFSAGAHPFVSVDEEGLRVLQHVVSCGRNGVTRLLADCVLTYISKHAVGRLHERNHRLTAGSAFNVFGFLGILGLLAHHSDKHARSGLCLRYPFAA